MSSMDPDQPQQPPVQASQQFFPTYQAPNGQPQPYMGATEPSLPSPQQGGMPPTFPIPSSKPPRNIQLFLLIPLIVFVILTLVASGFGYWAYGERQDYKENSDKKAAAAVDSAVKQESDRKDTEFIDKEKQPYKTYTSPEATGSIKITYPKTWSAWTNENEKGTPVVDNYWHPDVVPGLSSNVAYALRLEVTNRVYVDEVRNLDSLVKAGSVKVVPYVPKNVSGISGVKVQGEITKGKNSTMIIFPLRDKTVKLYTESPDFANDFAKIVLENLTFTP